MTFYPEYCQSLSVPTSVDKPNMTFDLSTDLSSVWKFIADLSPICQFIADLPVCRRFINGLSPICKKNKA